MGDSVLGEILEHLAKGSPYAETDGRSNSDRFEVTRDGARWVNITDGLFNFCTRLREAHLWDKVFSLCDWYRAQLRGHLEVL